MITTTPTVDNPMAVVKIMVTGTGSRTMVTEIESITHTLTTTETMMDIGEAADHTIMVANP